MDPRAVGVRTADQRPWRRPAADVAEALGVGVEHGLSPAEVVRRLTQSGPNELIDQPAKSLWRMLADQFANTMIVVLIVAAGVTALLGEISDTIVIGVIVVLNAAIGLVQEYRAEQAMAALKRMTAAIARVTRAGAVTSIDARNVVPGDLLHLEAGDVVAADARLVQAANLRVDEAALTGESVPVDKHADPLADDAGELVADRTNMVFKGTSAVHGRGLGVVVATGMATELGSIAALLQARSAPPTPLQRRLAVLGRRLALAALVICGVVFIVGVARGEPVSLMFLTAVSLAVAAIPEALPAVVTVALALGAQRMARHRAIVRKLPAVETLGSVTVICTDKTGTLTQANMQVDRIWTADGGTAALTGSGYDPDGDVIDRDSGSDVGTVEDVALVAALCNDATLVPPTGDEAWAVRGDPTEGALLAMARKLGVDATSAQLTHPRIAEAPFDAVRKRMSTVHSSGGGVLIATKGALESVLAVASRVSTGDGEVTIDETRSDRIRTLADGFAADGYRVLALAGDRRSDAPASALEAEDDLVLYGLVAMADAIRDEARDAVAECISAGIVPVMITGDHPATARAIAERVGIIDHHRVLTGTELAHEGAAGLARHVAEVRVYARTTPEQKLDIVEAWKAIGHTVAMTGDGVNDAPALRRADIGVAMGVAGSEVSKEAADMVLADDNFATIVTAVREGRRIYDNIRRFVRYTLTSNSGEIWVMFLAPFLGLPLPLLPVHILWINLVTDGLPGLALGVEPAERDVMKRPPRPPTESVFARGLWQHVLVVGLLMGAIPLSLGVWGFATGRPWQTMIFTSLALLQLGHALAVRSESQSLRSLGVGTNLPLLLAVIGTILLQLAAVYWPPAQTILRTDPLAAADLVVVLTASTGVFWGVELEKLIRRRHAAG